MASVDIYPSPVVAEAQDGHPGASNGHSYLRGDLNIHPTKTGVQKRIDKLVARNYELQRTNEEQAAQLEHGMLEIAELKTDNFRLQESLARCIEALRKTRMNG
jgi:predicted nuclease with TOPRIM domain